MISRHEPVTAYRIVRLFEADPVSGFNESMGQVYPAINRMSDRGLVAGERIDRDRRQTVKWTLSQHGEHELREWAQDFKPDDMILADPLHPKVLTLGLMPYQDRLDWLSRVKQDLSDKLIDLEAAAQGLCSYDARLIHDGLLSSARARMDWLDRVFVETVKNNDRDN